MVFTSGPAAALMEEGTRSKKTVFIGGISDDVDEAVLLETFSTFGESSTSVSRRL